MKGGNCSSGNSFSHAIVKDTSIKHCRKQNEMKIKSFLGVRDFFLFQAQVSRNTEHRKQLFCKELYMFLY